MSLSTSSVDVAFRVLQFCNWTDRVTMSLLNQHWNRNVFGTDDLWRFFSQRLEEECYVYVPLICPHPEWKDFFKNELWPLRLRWAAAQKGTATSYRFTVSVVARFRPKATHRPVAGAKPTVHLPLHQRLQLLRSQHGCSTDGAMQLLFGPSQGFFDSASLPEDGQFQPRKQHSRLALDGSSPKHVLEEPLATAGVMSVADRQVVMCAPGVGLRAFTCFDAVHGERDTQAMLYDSVGRRQVLEFLNGMNCTIICYGQTGSGKTYTLFGPDSAASCSLTLTATSGIVPRACVEICEAVARRQAQGIRCHLGVSYIEVFGEQVIDLLHDGDAVGSWRGTAARAALEGTASVAVSTPEELEVLLWTGERAKRRAATLMNDHSSRAHTLLLLTLTQEVAEVSTTCTLCVADLVGCEQLKKSGAQGERVQEAININTGLSALKRCIKALNEGDRYVPYQDSKLTMMLRVDSKMTVVVNGSMDADHALETMQALRFGEKCAVVKNEGQHRVSCVNELVATLDQQISECREEIRQKERWETTTVIAGVDIEGGVERVTTSRVVGAEAERDRLAELLELRRQLTGVAPEAAKGTEPPKKRVCGRVAA